MKRVFYEWDVEWTDEFGDVVDHDFHGDEFPGTNDNPNAHVVLVRTALAPDGICEEGRSWAYIDENGKLPVEFDDGIKVPARFHKQVK